MCIPDYFCDSSNSISYSIDWSDHISLYNFSYKFNLYCASPQTLSYLGMLYFSGFAIGSPFIPRLADIYGRKKSFYTCLFIQLLSTICIILIPAGPPGDEAKYFYLVIINFFIQGLCASGRPSIGYVYFCEFAP